MATKKNANVIRIDKLYPYSKNSLIHFREKQVAKKKKKIVISMLVKKMMYTLLKK